MKIKLSTINKDTSIQCRASLDYGVINDYTERMKDGDKFPPVILFGTKDKSWIGDGWHRISAAETLDRDSIEADLRPGGRVEALKHALSANAVHGVRRRREDIKRCVEIALKEFPDLSNVQVAEICGVDQSTIKRYRDDTSLQIKDAPATRLTSDGRRYPAKIKQPARAQEPDYQEGWQTHEPEGDTEPKEEEKPKQSRVVDHGMGRSHARCAINQIENINPAVDKDRYEAYIMIIEKIIEKTKNDSDKKCNKLSEKLQAIISE